MQTHDERLRTSPLGLHAHRLAVLLRAEAVSVPVAAAVPEAGAAAVLLVEEPAYREVAAGTSVLLQDARLCTHQTGLHKQKYIRQTRDIESTLSAFNDFL